jgi:hypothetical protein
MAQVVDPAREAVRWPEVKGDSTCWRYKVRRSDSGFPLPISLH